jgi:SAGA-associated factor 11
LQLPSHFFWDLLDSIIVDVASECHRVAKLGLDANLEEDDEELKLSAQARVRVHELWPIYRCREVCSSFGEMHGEGCSLIFQNCIG